MWEDGITRDSIRMNSATDTLVTSFMLRPTDAPEFNEAKQELARDITGVERYSLDDANRLYRRVWGASFHFGRWEADIASIEDATQRCKERIGEALAIGPHDSVLEVGSGLGETARFLAETHGCRVTASNVSEKHMRECRARTEQANLSFCIDSALADYHALPFDDTRYDAYVMQEALVHATEKHRVMEEAHRVLKPGRRMVFTDQTTNVEKLGAADRDRIIERHGSPDLFDAAAFERCAENAEFQILEHEDWSPHMARHFAELVVRIENDYQSLAVEIDPTVIEWNLETWRFARDKAENGAMGWSFIVAQKPA